MSDEIQRPPGPVTPERERELLLDTLWHAIKRFAYLRGSEDARLDVARAITALEERAFARAATTCDRCGRPR